MKGEIAKRDQKIVILLEEIKTLRILSKMPTEDQMARKVAKRELAKQEKQGSKKIRYEAPKKVRAMRQVDFQKNEEEEESDNAQISGEEELIRPVLNAKRKAEQPSKKAK